MTYVAGVLIVMGVCYVATLVVLAVAEVAHARRRRARAQRRDRWTEDELAVELHEARRRAAARVLVNARHQAQQRKDHR
ncbi:MAG TPA: hypothetical protein VF640_00745 [Acidimicrobiales bacterium]